MTAAGHGKNLHRKHKIHMMSHKPTLSGETWSYRSEVSPTAVVSCGNVSDVDDPDATARLWVRSLAVKVSDPAEDLLDGGRVITDDVGGSGHMMTIPGEAAK